MKKRAFISVFDKTGLEEFAGFLIQQGYEIISTGGTYRKLQEFGIEAIEIVDVTGAREILSGRVKSLHPKIFGGILARRDRDDDIKTLLEDNIDLIDIVVVNLYPFVQGLKENREHEDMVELIDIGGPSLLRAAAKNYKDVLVVPSPEYYERVMDEIKLNGAPTVSLNRELCGETFAITCAYDASIAQYMTNGKGDYLTLPYEIKEILRYGENSHQNAELFVRCDGKGVLNNIDVLWGKALSYNNMRDLDIAWKVVNEFEEPACCTLKHNTPCGAAIGKDVYDAYKKAYECDKISVFGGIVALNREVDLKTAEDINKIFIEIVMAPRFSEEALAVLKKKKNIRLIECNSAPADDFEVITIDGGILKQKRDMELFEEFKVVTEKAPTDDERRDMEFGMKIAKYIKSNGIIVVKDGRASGIGTGQVNRIWAVKEAIERGEGGKVLVSDGFFPFSDAVEFASENGISSIIQPGGSIRDKESIEECNRKGISMVFTSMRHFKH